jgi:hypothetical protein
MNRLIPLPILLGILAPGAVSAQCPSADPACRDGAAVTGDVRAAQILQYRQRADAPDLHRSTVPDRLDPVLPAARIPGAQPPRAEASPQPATAAVGEPLKSGAVKLRRPSDQPPGVTILNRKPVMW